MIKNIHYQEIKLHLLLFGILAGLISVSCEDFVEVGTPNSQLSSSTVFDNTATANAAMAYIYGFLREQSPISGNPQGLSLTLGLYTDEMEFYTTSSQPSFPFYTNNLLPSDPTSENYWNTSYRVIYAANSLIEGINVSLQIPEIERQRLHGEALFVKAFMHLYLTSLYGDIPYVEQADYRVNTSPVKDMAAVARQKVIDDLRQAIELLPEQYNTPNKATPNKAAAQSLLARVLLYNADYAGAIDAATAVLDQTGYQLADEPSGAFLRESPEVLWQLAPATEGFPTLEAATFTLYAAPPEQWALNSAFLSYFSDNDLRKAQWIGTVSDGIQTFYFPAKYRQSSTEATSTEYAVMMRIAEVVLIRAEAAARLGQTDLALSDLNRIRQRAGIQLVDITNPVEIVQEILNERARELFCEQGHRFFDLRRFGQLDTVLGTTKAGWDTSDTLFPLPQTELNLNPNLLPQNPGY
jgi:hypothetical protein